MLLSSAYRANRSPRRSNSRSNSSSTMFDSKGDKGPPCGVPSSTGLTSPFSMTPAVTLGDILLRLGHCLMGRPPRTESVAVLGKRRVPPALQNLHYRLLDESV